jgi:hypothetical protein
LGQHQMITPPFNSLIHQQVQTSMLSNDSALPLADMLSASNRDLLIRQRAGVNPTLAYGDANGLPAPSLPVILCLTDDHRKLSEHQILLRQQIEVFGASKGDVSTHTRGRNKPIMVNQVGIRCRHCKHLPVSKRQKGSAYFPGSTIGLYQAAQNMSTTHIQCGLCSEMPEKLKRRFAELMSCKNITSGAGRKHWGQAARSIGLVDTEDGIRFIHDMPAGSNS